MNRVTCLDIPLQSIFCNRYDIRCLHHKISTYPSVPCTRIRCPSLISLVAFSTPTTAGKPCSRAMTAPWVINPPTSVTRPLMDTNNGVHLNEIAAGVVQHDDFGGRHVLWWH